MRRAGTSSRYPLPTARGAVCRAPCVASARASASRRPASSQQPAASNSSRRPQATGGHSQLSQGLAAGTAGRGARGTPTAHLPLPPAAAGPRPPTARQQAVQAAQGPGPLVHELPLGTTNTHTHKRSAGACQAAGRRAAGCNIPQLQLALPSPLGRISRYLSGSVFNPPSGIFGFYSKGSAF
jgi:hypothetical protein